MSTHAQRALLYCGALFTPFLLNAQSSACATCHPGIAKSYAKTGMGRSFFRPSPSTAIEDFTRGNPFFHKASGTWYAMSVRNGVTYQRRWRLAPDGSEQFVQESRIDYIMGSGNRARTYLHRTERGALIELPLAWYAEKGGGWAMSPGHDREYALAPRTIAYECMFCHNAYPRIPQGHEESGSEALYSGALPEGIDCQRCHGPGDAHVRAAQSGAGSATIRAAIVNPARLSPERQMEVCMQCHLETTSLPLPHSIQRYNRAPFSYRPGEPLANFEIFFDHAPGSKYQDDFEIAHSAYRLRKSQCFLRSAGKLTCTTCHNPHDIPRGVEATNHYNQVCRQCHATVAAANHTAAADCVACHMPKRRTQDVIHVAMTDHLIRRTPLAGDPLAPLSERQEWDANQYRGEVVPYYPAPLPKTAENELYAAVAQGARDIPRLASAIARAKPTEPAFYIELGQAYLDGHRLPDAIGAFEEAVRLRPTSPVAALNLAEALTEAGRTSRAVALLRRFPRDPLLRYQLGITETAAGNAPAAIAAFRDTLTLDPDFGEAHNLLGAALAGAGDLDAAETELSAALRIHPDSAAALANVARLRMARGDLASAVEHFARAVQLKPKDGETRTNYAAALAALGRIADARQQVEAAVAADPTSAAARDLRGRILERSGDPAAALTDFLAALQLDPAFALAHLDAARVLGARGDRAAALEHLRRAAGSPDPNIRRQAEAVLQRMQ